MKDSVVNLLVFSLLFAMTALFVVGEYFLYNLLVPGGRGLIFGSPWVAALFPALLIALIAAQYRSVHYPGRFAFTWLFLAGGLFFLLLFSFPAIDKAPSIRSPDAPLLVPGRFLMLEHKGVLFAPPGQTVAGQFTRGVLSIPGNQSPMTMLEGVGFDPLNQRFLLPGEQGGPKSLQQTGPERAYFGYPEFLKSLQNDLFVIYQVLKGSQETQALLYLAQCAVVTLLFLGLFVFFSFKAWPLLQIILVLFMTRVELGFLAYSLVSLPQVVQQWWPGATFLQDWLPVGWIALAGLALFFMTMLTKPRGGKPNDE